MKISYGAILRARRRLGRFVENVFLRGDGAGS